MVGSGVAGLSAALAAAEQGAQVRVLTAGEALSGSSWWAQGGVAAALGDDDTPAFHAADTLAVGASLNDRHAVDVLVEEGRRAAIDLLAGGVPFDGGTLPDLGLEAGHGHRRILHAGGGATGAMLSAALLSRVLDHPTIQLVDRTPVDGLLLAAGRVVGVASRGKRYRAGAVVLATGGYAGLWGRSTNPPGNRGVGLWLAWHAGATLADLEFVQFHPTALNLPGAPAFLLSEAIRGEGARLVDAAGREVIDPLLPRDVLSRALTRRLNDEGPVYLSLRHLDPSFVEGRFAGIAAQLRSWGLDLPRDPVPVAPAAHYCMGGIRTDTDGRTDLPGLYAAGEVACTGAQGANRLASNSLLECLVFGGHAGVAAVRDEPGACAHWPAGPLPEVGEQEAGQTAPPPTHYPVGSLARRLDRDLGVERDAVSLRSLAASLPHPGVPEAPPDHLTAGLVARAALLRNESRGAHYRTDAPQTRPEWRGRILWRQGEPPRFEEVLD